MGTYGINCAFTCDCKGGEPCDPVTGSCQCRAGVTGPTCNEPCKAEFEKTIGFIVIFLENFKNFVIFTKSSNKFGEFLNFLGFSNIFLHFLVFPYAFLIFLNALENSRKVKKFRKIHENPGKCYKILESLKAHQINCCFF